MSPTGPAVEDSHATTSEVAPKSVPTLKRKLAECTADGNWHKKPRDATSIASSKTKSMTKSRRAKGGAEMLYSLDQAALERLIQKKIVIADQQAADKAKRAKLQALDDKLAALRAEITTMKAFLKTGAEDKALVEAREGVDKFVSQTIAMSELLSNSSVNTKVAFQEPEIEGQTNSQGANESNHSRSYQMTIVHPVYRLVSHRIFWNSSGKAITSRTPLAAMTMRMFLAARTTIWTTRPDCADDFLSARIAIEGGEDKLRRIRRLNAQLEEMQRQPAPCGDG
ncbi:hypothetical protein K458DRAFT_467088 [Lentithecium fluviatile CBS 122367]|uniref:Uncharacterized protein n=1 Tax=Lentithecium fluviatile CBS 122367 TaxID=1168545 RepID=A0A6G1JBZ9_9PLEO|nr:hypothetical protein K458DRAFT_467088 [Lentithecium fluviatile CBS 122367]